MCGCCPAAGMQQSANPQLCVSAVAMQRCCSADLQRSGTPGHLFVVVPCGAQSCSQQMTLNQRDSSRTSIPAAAHALVWAQETMACHAVVYTCIHIDRCQTQGYCPPTLCCHGNTWSSRHQRIRPTFFLLQMTEMLAHGNFQLHSGPMLETFAVQQVWNWCFDFAVRPEAYTVMSCTADTACQVIVLLLQFLHLIGVTVSMYLQITFQACNLHPKPVLLDIGGPYFVRCSGSQLFVALAARWLLDCRLTWRAWSTSPSPRLRRMRLT